MPETSREGGSGVSCAACAAESVPGQKQQLYIEGWLEPERLALLFGGYPSYAVLKKI